jgi:hypothetical protein
MKYLDLIKLEKTISDINQKINSAVSLISNILIENINSF